MDLGAFNVREIFVNKLKNGLTNFKLSKRISINGNVQ